MSSGGKNYVQRTQRSMTKKRTREHYQDGVEHYNGSVLTSLTHFTHLLSLKLSPTLRWDAPSTPSPLSPSPLPTTQFFLHSLTIVTQ